MEHSENKIITHFENEVGFGVRQSSIQHVQKFHTTRTESIHNQQGSCLSDAGLEYYRSDLVFKHPVLRNNFIFGILYLYFLFRWGFPVKQCCKKVKKIVPSFSVKLIKQQQQHITMGKEILLLL